jgi:hypothetical protein
MLFKREAAAQPHIVTTFLRRSRANAVSLASARASPDAATVAQDRLKDIYLIFYSGNLTGKS